MIKNLSFVFILLGFIVIQGSCEDPVIPPTPTFPTKLMFRWIIPVYLDSSFLKPSQFYFSGNYITFATMDKIPDRRGIVVLNRLTGKKAPNWLRDPYVLMQPSNKAFDDFDIGGESKEIAYLSNPWYVHAYNINTGKKIWEYSNSEYIMDNRFSVIEPNLYQGYWPGDPFSITWAKLARYNYKTGLKEDLFTKETIPGYRFGISPPVGFVNNQNDTLLIGVTSYQNYTSYHCVFQAYCFNLRTRSMEWENDQFVNDHDYSDNLPVLIENDKVIIQTVSKLSCLDVHTGKLIWQKENLAISLNMTFPLYQNGKVFCLTDDGKLFCFDSETGSEIWSITSPIFQPIDKSNFIYYEGKIYFNSYKNYDMVLNCVSAETGEVLWRDRGAHGTMRGYLLLDENLGFLYGYCNGFVYCIDLNQTPIP